MPRAELVQRLALGLAAVAMIVWVAVSIADRQALADARKAAAVVFDSRASTAAKAAGVRQAVKDTRGAGSLRPGDHEPQVDRVYLYLYGGRLRDALKEAEQLTRAEPSNRVGWLAIVAVTRSKNPRRAAQAEAQLRKLVRDPSRPRRR